MIRKYFIMIMTIALGLFMASGAMAANLPDIAATLLPDGHTAGTILNPEGKGDALIFPYYDVRELNLKLQDTYFAIINETVSVTGITSTIGGVAAKLRFREWDKSEEVYDVDIWLSNNDVWIGLINQDTVKDLARLWSPDWVIVNQTPTSFILQKALDVRDAVTGALLGREFRTTLIGLPNDRSLYGYFEVIGEELTYCQEVDGVVTRTLEDCPNTLAGYAYIVRVADGVAMAYNATAFANFARNLGSLYSSAGGTLPTLLEAEDTIDQLEFLIAKYYISQGFSIEASIGAQFSVIVTFPTKHFHFDSDPPYSLNDDTISYGRTDRPRGEPFLGDTANSGEEISLIIFDRDENPFLPPPGFESPPQETEELRLPYEVNIAGLYVASAAPTITNPRDNVGFPTGTFDSGWFIMDFQHSKTLPDGNTKITVFNYFGNTFNNYIGLPLIGMVAQEFQNGAAGGFYGEFLPIFYDVNYNNAT